LVLRRERKMIRWGGGDDQMGGGDSVYMYTGLFESNFLHPTR